MFLMTIDTHLSVDELQVARALRVTVTGTVLGTSLVAIVLGQTTVGVHGDEVQGSVETARKLGAIHIEGELLVEQLEHLVSAVVLHEEQTRANVGTSDEAQSQSVAIGGGTVGGLIVGTIQGTVCGTGLVVRAESRVPLFREKVSQHDPDCQTESSYGVASVTVGGTVDGVEPTPVGINDNRALLVSAASSGGTLLPGQRGMSLSRQSASLLSTGSRRQGREKEGFLIHCR